MNGRVKAFLKDFAVEFFVSVALWIVGLAVIYGVVVLFRGPEQGVPGFIWSLPEIIYWIAGGAALFVIWWAVDKICRGYWTAGGAVVFKTWWAVNMMRHGLRTRGDTSPEDQAKTPDRSE